MKNWSRFLVGGGAALAGAAAAAYFGIGYILYCRMTSVRGDCDEHKGNRPDAFVDIGGYGWPPLDFSPCYMARYETVRFPSRQSGIKIREWYIEGKPGAPAVILVHGG